MVVWFVAGSTMNESYEINVQTVHVPTDEAGVARGRHVVQSFGLCQECHGDRLQGELLEDDPVFGRIASRNLTSGKGGIGRSRSDLDFVRSIRHRVGPDGKSLLFMPSELFYYLSDSDLGAVIAYLKSLPPVDNELPETSLGPLGRVFALMGMPFLPAREIDHTATRPAEPEPAATVEYGKYLGRACLLCHGNDLSGEGGVQDTIPPPNLTRGGRLGSWSVDDFVKALRTGVTPRDHELDPDEMPWKKSLSRLTDDELTAPWMYLGSVPPVAPKDAQE